MKVSIDRKYPILISFIMFLFSQISCEYLKNNQLEGGIWTGVIIGSILAIVIVWVIVKIIRNFKNKNRLIKDNEKNAEKDH